MKNIFLVLFAIGIFSCQSPASDADTQGSTGHTVVEAQTNSEKAASMQAMKINEQDPVSINVLPTALDMPKPIKLCQNEYGCSNQKIYPIGWGEDGKFAYCFEHPKSASDVFTLEFKILDLNTGEVLDGANYKGSSSINFKQLWENKKIDFQEAFDQYGIKIFDDFIVEGFPVKRQNKSISCAVDNVTKMNDYAGVNVVEKTIVSIGDKQIFSTEYGKYDLVLDTEVLGYIKSPLDNHIVVIYANEKRGFEGPPNELKYTFIGATLAGGE